MALVSELIAVLTLNDAEFKAKISEDVAAMDEMSASSLGAAGAVAGAFALMAGAAVFVTNEVFKIADKINDLYTSSNKIGVTVAAMQALSFAAREAGVSSDSLQTMIGFMNKSLGNAELGTGNAGKALNALGLTLEQIKGLNPAQQFELISSKLGQVNDITLQTALATTLLGRGAKDGIGLFNSSIDEAKQKFESLGVSLTQSQAEAAHQLVTTKELVGSLWDGFLENVTADVAPAFTFLLQNILDGVKGMGGLKDAAQSTSDGIVSVMNKMVYAITEAIKFMREAKSIYDAFESSPIGKLNSEINTMWQSLIFGTANTAMSAATGLPRFGNESTAKTADAVQTNAQGQKVDITTGLIQEQQTKNIIDSAQAIKAFKGTTDAGTSALDTLKAKALSAAEVLDGFSKLQKDINAPGTKQADTIMQSAATANAKPLADASEFQEIYNSILKLSQGGNNGAAGQSRIPDLIAKLQDIINEDKTKNSGGPFGPAGAHGAEDVSGLVTALDNLKAFLGSKSNQQQEVSVSIKVDAGPDFVTTVTKQTTFKKAVEDQFKELTQAAARGN